MRNALPGVNQTPNAHYVTTGTRLVAYISGPIKNTPNFVENFAHAEDMLRELGYLVINPCHAFSGADYPTASLEQFMRFHIHSILASDVLVLLDGWEDSKGAGLEKAIAEGLGLPVFELSEVSS